MTTYYLARILLAYASFGATEDGRECLEWDLPQGKDSYDEIRVILKDGEAIQTEERKYADGAFTEWKVSYPSAAKSMVQTINECIRLVDALGMNLASIVGCGFNGEHKEEIEEEIPKRRIQRG